MLPYRDTKLTRILLGIFFLFVIGYAYYEARGLLFGPTIEFFSGTSSPVSTDYVLIQGRADRITSLSVDGNPIQVTEIGGFKEPYVLSAGANRIVFDAKDKYGHTTEKVVEIVYIPSAASSSQTSTTVATSSTATSTIKATTIPIGAIPYSSAIVSPDVAPGR